MIGRVRLVGNLVVPAAVGLSFSALLLSSSLRLNLVVRSVGPLVVVDLEVAARVAGDWASRCRELYLVMRLHN